MRLRAAAPASLRPTRWLFGCAHVESAAAKARLDRIQVRRRRVSVRRRAKSAAPQIALFAANAGKNQSTVVFPKVDISELFAARRTRGNERTCQKYPAQAGL